MTLVELSRAAADSIRAAALVSVELATRDADPGITRKKIGVADRAETELRATDPALDVTELTVKEERETRALLLS
jgi:hypothetical protein